MHTFGISGPYMLFPPPSLWGFKTKSSGFFNAISIASSPAASLTTNFQELELIVLNIILKTIELKIFNALNSLNPRNTVQ